MKSSTKTDAFFRVSPTLTSNHEQTLEAIERNKALEGSGRGFVILAHDATLQGQIDLYLKINDWKMGMILERSGCFVMIWRGKNRIKFCTGP